VIAALAGCSSGTGNGQPDGEEQQTEESGLEDADGGIDAADVVPDGQDEDGGVDAADEVQDGQDGGEDGDAGSADGDGGDPFLWDWCPDPSAYVGGNWNYQASVTDQALFCVINQGFSVEEAMGSKAQLRVVPGSYPLPQEDGTYPLLIPACIRVPENVESQHAGEGLLTVTTEYIGDYPYVHYAVSQPMMVGIQPWTIEMNFSIYNPGNPYPDLVLDNRLSEWEGGHEISKSYILDNEVLDYPWWAFPCLPASANRRETGGTFDRGQINVWNDVIYDIPSGGHAPAILQRGWGELDGTAFDQEDYFKLSHLPAHHNWGGSFLVMFEQPIGPACGIKLCIPSMDGGGPDLGAWTVDCSLDTIDQLTGLDPLP
jgi:hypothetical protein